MGADFSSYGIFIAGYKLMFPKAENYPAVFF